MIVILKHTLFIKPPNSNLYLLGGKENISAVVIQIPNWYKTKEIKNNSLHYIALYV